MNRFEIHFHSMYSNIRLIDCINKIKPSILQANKIGLKGLSLTDHEALCGHIDWLLAEKELKEKELIPQDFKCALGNEIYLTETREQKQKYYHAILLAKDTEGHRQLRELSSNSWLNSYTYGKMERVPTLKKELEEKVRENKGHLIFSSSCLASELATLTVLLVEAEKNNDEEFIYSIKNKINDYMIWLIELFGDDFYVEIAPGTSKDQLIYNNRVKSIAKAYNRKIVIGSDAHFITKDKQMIHQAFLNSKDGDRDVESFYKDAWLMDEETIIENLSGIFSKEEIEEIFNNSMEIYNKIENYNILHKSIIPKVKVKAYDILPDNISKELESYDILNYLNRQGNEQERYWLNQCIEGIIKIDKFNKTYLERLNTEADVIKHIGDNLEDCLFAYFNTFQHFIDLFWECGSIVGPGRGSSCGFLSNYAMGITSIDPIQWELPWFRFLNKDRVELPD